MAGLGGGAAVRDGQPLGLEGGEVLLIIGGEGLELGGGEALGLVVGGVGGDPVEEAAHVHVEIALAGVVEAGATEGSVGGAAGVVHDGDLAHHRSHAAFHGLALGEGGGGEGLPLKIELRIVRQLGHRIGLGLEGVEAGLGHAARGEGVRVAVHKIGLGVAGEHQVALRHVIVGVYLYLFHGIKGNE